MYVYMRNVNVSVVELGNATILPLRCQNVVKVRILTVGINRPTPPLGGRRDVKMRLCVLGAARFSSTEADMSDQGSRISLKTRSGTACRSPLGRGALPTIAPLQAYIRSDRFGPFYYASLLYAVLALFASSSCNSAASPFSLSAASWRHLVVVSYHRLSAGRHTQRTSKFCIRNLEECRDPYMFLYSALGRQTRSQCCAEPHVRQRSDRNGVPVPDVEMHLCNLRSGPGTVWQPMASVTKELQCCREQLRDTCWPWTTAVWPYKSTGRADAGPGEAVETPRGRDLQHDDLLTEK